MAGAIAVGVLTAIAGARGWVPEQTDGWGGYSAAVIVGVAPVLSILAGLVIWIA
jgi:hypothetical protein